MKKEFYLCLFVQTLAVFPHNFSPEMLIFSPSHGEPSARVIPLQGHPVAGVSETQRMSLLQLCGQRALSCVWLGAQSRKHEMAVCALRPPPAGAQCPEAVGALRAAGGPIHMPSPAPRHGPPSVPMATFPGLSFPARCPWWFPVSQGETWTPGDLVSKHAFSSRVPCFFPDNIPRPYLTEHLTPPSSASRPENPSSSNGSNSRPTSPFGTPSMLRTSPSGHFWRD